MKLPRHKIMFFFCLLLLLLGCLVQIFAGYSHMDQFSHAWGVDDAYISYRYAENLVRGNGLVFNPGERVEGYSNFLYVLFMSLGVLLLGKEVYLFSVLFNMLLIMAAFYIFHQYVRSRLGDDSAVVAVFLFALCPPIWAWVASGLETPLVLLLQLAIWFTVEEVVDDAKPYRLLPLCGLIILSILARADGFILPLVAVFYLFLKGKNRPAIYTGLSIIFTLIGYSLWRYSYYGDLLPNTYYAKISGPLPARFKEAGKQLQEIAMFQGFLPYLLAFGFILIEAIKNHFQRGTHIFHEIRLEVVFALSWLLYWFYIGGDFFQERLLLILFPMGVFALLKSIGVTLQKRALAFVAILVIILQLFPLANDQRFTYAFNKYDRLIALGKFLGKNYPGKTLAIDAAGKVPYYSNLKTIDMLGLNDKFLARKKVDWFSFGHNKFDTEYVFSKNPDLIAAWVDEGLDLAFGLKKQAYEKAGYRLKYLVRSQKSNPRAPLIVDISRMDESDIRRLFSFGYQYGILEKRAE